MTHLLQGSSIPQKDRMSLEDFIGAVSVIAYRKAEQRDVAQVETQSRKSSQHASVVRRKGPSRLWQFFQLLQRAMIKWYRARAVKMADMSFAIAAALIVGGIYRTKLQEVGNAMTSTLLFSSMTLGVVTTVAGLRPFGVERMVYWREASSGVSTLSYFVSKNLVFLIDIVALPFLYTVAFSFLTTPTMGFITMFTVFVGLAWATSGLGVLIAAGLHPSKALLVAVLVAVIFGGFLAGVSPYTYTRARSAHAHDCMHTRADRSAT